MMRDAINNFAKQFACEPAIDHAKMKKYSRYIVAGMGGSHLAADLALAIEPALPLLVWSDYGLPPISDSILKKSLTIACSYSGNTEETLSAFDTARKKKLPLAVIAVGGKLIDLAHKHRVPCVRLPDTGIQPRMALGFMLRAIYALMQQERGLRASRKLATTLAPQASEAAGLELAEKLRDRVPVIYASRRNTALAANWKIKFNETGKIPAFYNVFSELNHNEMTGFDVKPASKHLSERFSCVLLRDSEDHPRIVKRMGIMADLYRARNLPVTFVEIQGKTRGEALFSSLLLADWTALATAELYGLESEQVPMVEEFKKQLLELH